MKKLFPLFLLALFGAAFVSASLGSRAEYVTRVETCEAILQEFQDNPATAIPATVLARAQAIIITNQVKAGFIIGIKDGYGVMMVKHADGKWSLPVIVAAGEFSVGFQIGVNTYNTVMVITDQNTPRILFDRRFNLGVDAKAVGGPHAAEAESNNRELLATPVLVYSKAKGLYAGATVKTGWLERSDPPNWELYNTTYTMPELLYADWVQPVPEVVPLMEYVQKLAP